MDDSIYIRAPGRVCLFGEHQDYLGFPVIAAAINCYIFIKARESLSSHPNLNFKVSMPDIDQEETVVIPPQDSFLDYKIKRDYLRSGINLAKHEGAAWTNSWNIKITGNIPIKAGVSSSSAFVIAWLIFLFHAAKKKVSIERLAILGYLAEVEEFKEPGGQMDQFTSSYGKIVYVESRPSFKATSLFSNLEGFILANSGIEKDTVRDLHKVKAMALSSFKSIRESLVDFDRFTTPLEKVQPFLSSLSAEEQKALEGQLISRDLTQEALKLFNAKKFNHILFGQLLSKHHKILTEKICVSVPTIDRMVDIAIDAGALGAKINGSGFGGTMFAYAPKKQIEVLEALSEAGFESWIIDISSGAEIVQKNSS